MFKRIVLITLITITAFLLGIGTGILYYVHKHKPKIIRTVCTTNKKSEKDVEEKLYKIALKYAHVSVTEDMVKQIVHECLKYREGKLLLAMAIVETNLRPWMINGARKYENQAWGLLQIKPYLWKNKLIKQGIISKPRDLFDYKKNIAAAHYILKEMYNRASNWYDALYLYCGKSRKYANKVLRIYGELTLDN